MPIMPSRALRTTTVTAASFALIGASVCLGAAPAVAIEPPPAVPVSPIGLPPGIHVSVVDGEITVSNPGGTLQFAPGQFGFTPKVITPPAVVPPNPGLHFTLPPAFNAAGGALTPPAASCGGSRSRSRRISGTSRRTFSAGGGPSGNPSSSSGGAGRSQASRG